MDVKPSPDKRCALIERIEKKGLQVFGANAVSYEDEKIILEALKAFTPSHALRNEHPAGNRTNAGPGERSPDQPREVGRTPTQEAGASERPSTERDRAEGSGSREIGQNADRGGLDAAPCAPSTTPQKTFAERLFAESRKAGAVEWELFEKAQALFGEHAVEDTSYDEYDTSAEFYITADIVPTPEQVATVLSWGFSRFWINFPDETEIHVYQSHVNERRKRNYEKWRKGKASMRSATPRNRVIEECAKACEGSWYGQTFATVIRALKRKASGPIFEEHADRGQIEDGAGISSMNAADGSTQS